MPAIKLSGTREWAAKNLNIALGCEHNCRYCYARYNAVTRFKRVTADAWPHMRIDQAKVDAEYGRDKGIIMFPSSHDVTPSIISEYLCVLHKLLEAGNQVLIVTKPHWECIPLICESCREFKDQIIFRFTIGSVDEGVLRFWEPGAPSFEERISCLRYAYARGFRTSVSCEPYLDAYVPYTFLAVSEWITDSFWVGKLRGFGQRVNLDGVTDYERKRYVEPLLRVMDDSIVRAIYKALEIDGQPYIKWKDSIRRVMLIDQRRQANHKAHRKELKHDHENKKGVLL